MYIRKKETKIIETIVGCQCDVCGKQTDRCDYPDDWVGVTTGHNDWGNDSCDSVESLWVCSIACLQKVLAKAIDSDSGYVDLGRLERPFIIALLSRLVDSNF